MLPLASAYLFLLGLASGITLLTITSYRHVSPRWLRALLIASGLVLMSRYLTMMLFTSPEAPERFWALRRCWFASSIGLTLPSVFAVDQLIRHPAMTPRKLLRWYAPFFIAYTIIMVGGQMTAVPDRIIGWMPRLQPGWSFMLSITQTIFVLGFLGLCAMLIRKIPSTPIRIALAALAAGQIYLGIDGLLLALGRWYARPFLYSEMTMLLALWYAYETSVALQQSS